MGGESTSRAPPCLSLGHCLYARLPSPRQGKSPGPPYRTRFSNLAARPPAPQIPLPWPRLLELPFRITKTRGQHTQDAPLAPQTKGLCQASRPRHSAQTARTHSWTRDLLSLPPPHGQDPLTPPPSSKTPSPSGRPRAPPPGRLWELQARADGMKFWVLNSGLSEMRWSQLAGLPVATAGIGEREGYEVCVRQSVHI